MSSAAFVATAAQLACLLEVSADKPGNVSPGHHFPDARYEDFLASAAAIGPALTATLPLGATIFAAIESTVRWTRSNTNLGIVLLFAPLALASRAQREEGAAAVSSDVAGSSDLTVPGDLMRLEAITEELRGRVRKVLRETTVEDARQVYAAIRLAKPGGMGRVEDEDVESEPRVTLLETMQLAADRDGVAREYVTAFETTFEAGVPALERARGEGLRWDDAIVETFLALLAVSADTHIARKHGRATAAEVSGSAAAVMAAGATRTANGRAAIQEFDRRLRSHSINPGTTADLTAAAIFVALLGGAWST